MAKEQETAPAANRLTNAVGAKKAPAWSAFCPSRASRTVTFQPSATTDSRTDASTDMLCWAGVRSCGLGKLSSEQLSVQLLPNQLSVARLWLSSVPHVPEKLWNNRRAERVASQHPVAQSALRPQRARLAPKEPGNGFPMVSGLKATLEQTTPGALVSTSPLRMQRTDARMGRPTIAKGKLGTNHSPRREK